LQDRVGAEHRKRGLLIGGEARIRGGKRQEER